LNYFQSGALQDVRQYILARSLKNEKLTETVGFFFSNKVQACLLSAVR
jgi:hypothetical protein